MHIHALDGCAPAPLAHYLKALGVLRVVAEQADATVRGWWEGERFRLATVMSEEQLLKFLAERYEPMPIFNPWGGRSGFYTGSSETGARQSLQAIEHCRDARLAQYQSAIADVRASIAAVCGGKKPKDADRLRVVADLRKRVRGRATRWLDTVVAMISTSEGELGIVFPPVFGTGGNEGSGSYTSAYMAAVVECVVERGWDQGLPALLFGRPTPHSDSSTPMGQFAPLAIGTPWELLLAFEGACLLRSAAVAKHAGSPMRTAASPFSVRPSTFGYASAGRLDEYALKQGKELPGRGEQWFPLWDQPMLCDELSQILGEGRASVGRNAARDGWSMARAAASLGVRRGITEFVRYGYLQRNNQATHFAVPIGRFKVSDSVGAANSCVDDLDRWFHALRLEARRKEAGVALRVGTRALADSLFDVLQHTDQPTHWQSALLSLAAVEAVMRSGSGFKAQPVPPLRPEWVSAADDGTPEFRLALAFALQAAGFRRGDGRPLDPVRRHWLPLDSQRAGRFATTGDIGRMRLDRRADVVMQGRDGLTDALALLERRLVESAQSGQRGLRLQAAPRAAADPADLAAWLAGSVDPQRTLALARALMALDRGDWAEQIVPVSRPAAGGDLPDDAWLVLRLAHLAGPLPGGQKVACDPAILRRLASGDAAGAVALALRRLRAAGLYCGVRVAGASAHTARSWAAALAFPIHPHTAHRFARRLDPTLAQEHMA